MFLTCRSENVIGLFLSKNGSTSVGVDVEMTVSACTALQTRWLLIPLCTWVEEWVRQQINLYRRRWSADDAQTCPYLVVGMCESVHKRKLFCWKRTILQSLLLQWIKCWSFLAEFANKSNLVCSMVAHSDVNCVCLCLFGIQFLTLKTTQICQMLAL